MNLMAITYWAHWQRVFYSSLNNQNLTNSQVYAITLQPSQHHVRSLASFLHPFHLPGNTRTLAAGNTTIGDNKYKVDETRKKLIHELLKKIAKKKKISPQKESIKYVQRIKDEQEQTLTKEYKKLRDMFFLIALVQKCKVAQK